MKKRIRIFTSMLLVACFTGATVYADPAPSDTPETGTSEQGPAVPGDDPTTEATEELTETPTEEPTEEPTEARTENPTETPTESGTEKPTEAPTESGTEETTESGSESSSETSTEAANQTPVDVNLYYNSAQIAALRLKYSENVQATQQVRTLLNSMKRNQNSFIEDLQMMDEEIITLQGQMDQMEEEQRKIDSTLAQMEYELEFAEQDVQAQYQKLKEHIQNSYENGNYSFLDAVLHAANFSDILNKTEYVQQVSLYDSILLLRYQTARQKVANKMKMLKSMTEDYGALQAYYQDQQEAIVMLSDEKEKQILAYQSEIDSQQQDLTRLEVLRQQEANEIARLEAEARAAAARAATNGSGTATNISRDPIVHDFVPYDGGTFVWPQPSSTRITSDYGWRGDIGIPGASKDHKGIDIAANMYDPVVAAASGTVFYVGDFGTGGRTVMIDIGQGISIIYHHLNNYAVVKGDTVDAGQVVGYVGMTGVTGGPHLHFSVRLNGQYVNPRPYLGLPY